MHASYGPVNLLSHKYQIEFALTFLNTYIPLHHPSLSDIDADDLLMPHV